MKTENSKDQEPKIEGNENVRQIKFVSEGNMLQGKLFFPENLNSKKPGLIFIPSKSQEGQKEYADAVAKKGYLAMTFDLHGYGASQGDAQSAIMASFLNDATAAYDQFILDKNVDPEKITAVGSSLGAYLAILLAERRHIENLVLQNPANFPDDVMARPVADYNRDEPVPEWGQKLARLDSNASLKAVHEFEGNILIVESEFDEFKAEKATENYITSIKDAGQLRHEILVGAKHYLADPLQRMQYQNKLLAWLQEKCPT